MLVTYLRKSFLVPTKAVYLIYQTNKMKKFAVIITKANKKATLTFKFDTISAASNFAASYMLSGKLLDIMTFENSKWESIYF